MSRVETLSQIKALRSRAARWTEENPERAQLLSAEADALQVALDAQPKPAPARAPSDK